MCFRITIDRTRADSKFEEPSVTGLITIGDYQEEFVVSLLTWKVDDYVRQWKAGLERLKHESASCLVAAMRDLDVSDFINWWILYRIDDDVYIQNQMVFADDAQRPTEENIYACIPERVTVNEDGYRISEWKISFSDIEEWIGKFDEEIFHP